MVYLSIVINKIVGNSLKTVFCFYLAEKNVSFYSFLLWRWESYSFADAIMERYHWSCPQGNK